MSYRTLVGVAAVLTCLLADPWPGELFQSGNTPQQQQVDVLGNTAP